MKASVGRIVHYTLSSSDAEQINRRRTTGAAILERIHTGAWPLGAQAHIGNEASEGQVYPAMIVRVWGDSGCSNLQVFLDGNDTFWATSRNQADGEPSPLHWNWPPRVD